MLDVERDRTSRFDLIQNDLYFRLSRLPPYLCLSRHILGTDGAASECDRKQWVHVPHGFSLTSLFVTIARLKPSRTEVEATHVVKEENKRKNMTVGYYVIGEIRDRWPEALARLVTAVTALSESRRNLFCQFDTMSFSLHARLARAMISVDKFSRYSRIRTHTCMRQRCAEYVNPTRDTRN